MPETWKRYTVLISGGAFPYTAIIGSTNGEFTMQRSQNKWFLELIPCILFLEWGQSKEFQVCWLKILKPWLHLVDSSRCMLEIACVINKCIGPCWYLSSSEHIKYRPILTPSNKNKRHKKIFFFRWESFARTNFFQCLKATITACATSNYVLHTIYHFLLSQEKCYH